MDATFKRCTQCGGLCPVDAFNKLKKSRDGLNSSCRACTRATWQRWYSQPENRARHIRHNGGTSRLIIQRNQEYVASVLRASNCADCSIDDIRVLEFDHVRGTKFSAVSEMISSGFSITRIQAEIEKCEVVCANCHRIRTGSRGSFFKHTARP